MYEATLNSPGQALALSGTAITVNSLTLQAGTLNVVGGATLTVNGDVTNSGGTLATADLGQVAVGGNFNNASGASLLLESGSVSGNSKVIVTGAFTNAGVVTMQDVYSGTGGTLSAASFSNSGLISVGQGDTLISQGDFNDNTGSSIAVNSGTVKVGGNFNNANTATLQVNGTPLAPASVTVTGALNNSAGGVVNMIGSGDTLSAGSFANSGTIYITGGSAYQPETLQTAGNFVNNTGGALNIASGVVMIGGSFTNNSGAAVTMTTPQTTVGGTLTAASFANYGQVTVGTGDTLTSKGDFNNFAGSSLTITGSDLVVGGNLTNSGTATIQSCCSGDFFATGGSVSVTGAFTNNPGAVFNLSNTLTFLESNSLSAASIANSGQITVGQSDTLASAGNFNNNAGSSIAVNNATVTVGGNFNNASTATLQISGSPATTTEFYVPSMVTVTGTFTNNAGAVVNMIGTDGDTLTVGTFVNAGTVSLASGESLTSNGNFYNNTGGAMTLHAGSLTIGGNFVSAAGSSLIYLDPPTPGVTTVAGSFTNGGTVAMGGTGDTLTVGGAFTNSGTVSVGATEILNANGSYTNTGATTVAGTLNTTTYQQNAGSTDVSGVLNATSYQYNGGTTTIETGGKLSAASFTQSGGAIQGTGTIGSAGGTYTMTGGMITPGNSTTGIPGTLTFAGSFTQTGGTFEELIGPAGNGLLGVSGAATLGGSAMLDITLLHGFTPADGESFDIMDYGSESGMFANAPTGGFTLDGWNWDINYAYNGDEILLTAESPSTTATPEPSSWLLLFSGLLALGTFRRRKRVAA